MPLKVCIVSAEVSPFAKTGGLGDVSGALARYLAANDIDARLFFPFYSRVDRQGRTFEPVQVASGVALQMGRHRLEFSLFTTTLPGTARQVYLIDCPPLYGREGLYTEDPDEALRFAFLSRSAIECCRLLDWRPDVVHCNDWHTGLIPLYLRVLGAGDDFFAGIPTVLTIHNIAYQGMFPIGVLPDLGLADSEGLMSTEDRRHRRIGFLRTGILHADRLTTVSPTHADEIQTREYGCGLEEVLRSRRDHLTGILNGVDYKEWDPSVDPHLSFRYSVDDLEGKRKNKEVLVAGLNLAHDPAVPTLGLVSRLTSQKGIDLMLDPLPELLAERDIRFIALGSGETRYENYFQWLQHRFPEKVVFYRGFQNELAHLIEAGADIFLMPSNYEPCGLNQMYSLRYGTPPVVRRTGGLADTVEPFDAESGEGTGFVFEEKTPAAFRGEVERALELFADRDAWLTLMRNGMRRDFAWETQVLEYIELYKQLNGS